MVVKMRNQLNLNAAHSSDSMLAQNPFQYVGTSLQRVREPMEVWGNQWEDLDKSQMGHGG